MAGGADLPGCSTSAWTIFADDLTASRGGEIGAENLGLAGVFVPAQQTENHVGVHHQRLAVAFRGIFRQHPNEFRVAPLLPEIEHPQVHLTVEFAADLLPLIVADLI